LGSQGPWSVLNKTITPPSGDIHDYLSFAPYYWPNCSAVHNTTPLTPQEIWDTCPYYSRDGVFNPDYRTVNDSGHFTGLADAVLYNVLAWVISGQESYAGTAAWFIDTWFLNPETRANPNLNYSQVIRGPGKQMGDHEGVLDYHTIVKIVSGILIMRRGNFSGWTQERDTAMNDWATQYLTWLQTDTLGVQELAYPNNHGTWAYNQLAGLKILVGDITGAQAGLQRYFTNQYLSQINANGEQPLEAIRSRSYHYRAYNLGAMVTNAKLGSYINFTPDPWHIPTTQGADIQTACNFAMTINPNTTDEFTSAPAAELYQHVAAVASRYGDPEGTYVDFLYGKDPNFPAQPYFFWDQPLALPPGYAVSSPGPTPNRVSGVAPTLVTPSVIF